MKNAVSGLIPALLLIGMLAFVINFEVSSADPVSPYIAVVPEETVNPTLTVGMNYTVAIVTDYTGNDIWAWQFSLTYNPDVLQGGVKITDIWTGNSVLKIFSTTRKPIMPETERIYVSQTLMIRGTDYIIDNLLGKITFKTAPGNGVEVKATYLFGIANGDLITKTKHSSAQLIFGQGFNNTAGKLSLLAAFFFYPTPPPFTTSGPGILANITFRVVGTGYSDITLGEHTKLFAPPDFNIDPENPISIIDASKQPDHIAHGLFDNRLQVVKPAIDIDPDALNLKSKGKWITAYIQLPEEYNPEDIDASTILLNETVSPVLDPKYGFVTNSSECLVDYNNDGILERMVKFDQATVQAWIYQNIGMQGHVSLTVTGKLLDGIPFEGTDMISVFWTGRRAPFKR